MISGVTSPILLEGDTSNGALTLGSGLGFFDLFGVQGPMLWPVCSVCMEVLGAQQGAESRKARECCATPRTAGYPVAFLWAIAQPAF